MTATTETMIVEYLDGAGKSSLAAILANVKRSQGYVRSQVDLMVEMGQLSEEIVSLELGDEGKILDWARRPQPSAPEVTLEAWQIPPRIQDLIDAGVWTSEDGPADSPGVYASKPAGYRCCWTANYDGVPGYSSPLDLIGSVPLSQSAIQFEAWDCLAMGFQGDHMIQLGTLVSVPRPWDQTRENAIVAALNAQRGHYLRYLPHWLLAPTTVEGVQRFTLGFPTFGGAKFRRGWADYDASHAFVQLRGAI